MRGESSISATLYRDKVQVKHSYKVNELIRHKLELDELKSTLDWQVFVTLSGLAS